ncbi:MAG: hypothetical protein WCF78_04205 [archaeon]
MYEIIYSPDCLDYLDKLDMDILLRITKKIEKLRDEKQRRHLHHGIPIFVEDVNQYRICYELFEDSKIIRIDFIGKHKDYERWYKQSWS